MAISAKIKDSEVILEDAKENLTKIMVEDVPKVHNMVRWISKTNRSQPEMGIWTASEVDAHVSAWVEKGYKLFNTHYVGESPDGAYGFMYVLVIQ